MPTDEMASTFQPVSKLNISMSSSFCCCCWGGAPLPPPPERLAAAGCRGAQVAEAHAQVEPGARTRSLNFSNLNTAHVER
jgi:hypothetical protein